MLSQRRASLVAEAAQSTPNSPPNDYWSRQPNSLAVQFRGASARCSDCCTGLAASERRWGRAQRPDRLMITARALTSCSCHSCYPPTIVLYRAISCRVRPYPAVSCPITVLSRILLLLPAFP